MIQPILQIMNNFLCIYFNINLLYKMSGGRLITTGATFYRRGIPNSYKGFGLLTLNNYTVSNVKSNNFYFTNNTKN